MPFQPILPSAQTIYAPIAGLEEFASWQLAVVNRSPGVMPATITIYSRDGSVLASSKVALTANETRDLDIRALLPQGDAERRLGGVAISFSGQSLGVGAQVTLSAYRGFGNLDAPVFPDANYRSNTADAVWWKPRNSRSYLVLGNSSADTLQVKITDGEGKLHGAEVAPHATLVREVDGDGDRPEGVDSAHVEGTGAPGTLRVTGYIVSDEERFVNTIRSFDPATSSEAAVYANGLHFSGGVNHLVVKNVSTQTMRIWATIYPLDSTNSAGVVSIPPKSVDPGAATELDLSEIGSPAALDGAAIKVESTGPMASVIASLVNHSRQEHIVRAVPFKDIGDLSVSTGAYPWRLDGQFDSRIYITNVGKMRAVFGGQILPVDGQPYLIDSHYLDVGETAVFDIRKIRDEQTPDRRGIKLPKNAVVGQLNWSTILGDGSQRFIGRNEVVDRFSGVSASFSCGGCQCPLNTTAAEIDPSAMSTYVNGQVTNISTLAKQYSSCTGGYVDSFSVIPTSWSISTPSVLSLTHGQVASTMTGLSAGSSSFSTSFNGVSYAFDGRTQTCFVGATPQLNPSGNGTVQMPKSMLFFSDLTTKSNQCVVASQNATERIIQYQVIDQGGKPVAGIHMAENFLNLTPNTCNTLAPTPTPCSAPPTSSQGLFTDRISTNVCSPPNAGTCGFSINPDLWQYCTAGSPIKTIGTPTYGALWQAIYVDGSTATIIPSTPVPNQ
jgi:hypothetical protein